MEYANHSQASASTPARDAARTSTSGYIAIGFAIVGTAWTIFVISGWLQWISSAAEFAPIPQIAGDGFSGLRSIALHTIESISVITTLAMLYALIWRPLRRGSALSLHAKIGIGFILGYFIDPVINYFHYTFAYNTHAINMGAWSFAFPGFRGPRRFAEALLWVPEQYLWLGVGFGALQVLAMDRLRRRLPRLTVPQTYLILFGLFMIIDFIMENVLFIRLGLYSYSRTIGFLTVWPGTQYQFPLYNCVFVAGIPCAIAVLLRSAGGSGSGFLQVRVNGLPMWANELASTLGVAGYCAATLAVSYFGPHMFLSRIADSVPALPLYLWHG
jgi:hypothetical protein